MQTSLAFHEILSWIVAAVSFFLFIYERKKNNLTPFYMNLQGILKTCHAKVLYYWVVAKHYEESNTSNGKEDSIKWKGVSSDFEALKQTIMGVMKAIEPNKDMPFDDRDYTGVKNPAINDSTKIKDAN